MADKKISEDFVSNQISPWDGTEKIPAVKGGVNSAGLASDLATYVGTVIGTGGSINRGIAMDVFNVPTLM